MPATNMSYGSYTFSPAPMMSLQKEYVKAGDGTTLGATWHCSLNGTLLPDDLNDAGLDEIMSLQTELEDAFNQEGCEFSLACGASSIMSVHPRILNIQFPQGDRDKWTMSSDYSIEMEWDEATSGVNPYIRGMDESWQVEWLDSQSYYSWAPNGTTDKGTNLARLTHNVSATGRRVYDGCESLDSGKEAWEVAKDWVLDRIGANPVDTDDETEPTGLNILGQYAFGGSGLILYNHMRTENINEDTGEFSVSDNWLCATTGVGYIGEATEDFTMRFAKSSDSDITSVVIDGTIIGLEERTYPAAAGAITVSSNKWDNAKTAWTTVEARLYDRAYAISSGETTRTLQTTPVNTSVSHNPPKGQIQYSYTYDDKPCSYISGSLSESFNIINYNPVDIFTRIVIPGRAYGPILQNVSTITESKREATFEVVMPPFTGCYDSNCSNVTSALSESPTSEVECILKCLEDQLTSAYHQVFKHRDEDNWNPINGRYSRSIGWTFTNCSGDAPSTSLSC